MMNAVAKAEQSIAYWEPCEVNRAFAGTLLRHLGWDVHMLASPEELAHLPPRLEWLFFSSDVKLEKKCIDHLKSVAGSAKLVSVSALSDVPPTAVAKAVSHHLRLPLTTERLNGLLSANQPDTESHPVLDRDMLESIRELTEPGEEDFLDSMILMFFDRGPELIQEITTHFKNAESEKVSRSSHTLKGTAGNIGARRLMRVCEHLEQTSKSSGLDGLDPYVSSLSEVFKITIEELKKKWLTKKT